MRRKTSGRWELSLAAILLFGLVLSPARLAAETTLCGWIEAPTGEGNTGAWLPELTVCETGQVIPLDPTSDQIITESALQKLPGYFRIYEPVYGAGGVLAGFSRIERIPGCEACAPTPTEPAPEPQSSSSPLCGQLVTDYADSGMTALMVTVLASCSGERYLLETQAPYAGAGSCSDFCEFRDPVFAPTKWELRGGLVTQKLIGYSSVRSIAGCDECGAEREIATDTPPPPPPEPTDTPPPPQPADTLPPPPSSTDTPLPPSPTDAPPAGAANLVIAFALTPLASDEITVFQPNALVVEVTNAGDGDYAPLDARDYEIQLVLKKPGQGKLEEHHYAPASVPQLPNLPVLLRPGEIWRVRLDDVFLFTPVQDGEVEVVLRASGESDLAGNGSVQTITVRPHPESGWNCAAWIAKAVALVYPPAATAEWFFRMKTCETKASTRGEWTCHAESTAWWAFGMLSEVKDLADRTTLAIKFLASAHDVQEIAGEETPPCVVAVDWMNAMVREWMREGLPINAVFVQSPAYPLVTTSGGLRIGFLDSGEIVAEVPDSVAFLQGDSKVILYPGTDTAQIRLKGTADGPVGLSLVISQPGGGIALEYPAFEVNPSTVGTIDSRGGFATLELDQNGDGVVDAKVTAETESAQEVRPEPTPTGLIGKLGSALRDNPVLATTLGILVLLVVIVCAVLLLVLIGSRAGRKTAPAKGAPPQHRPGAGPERWPQAGTGTRSSSQPPAPVPGPQRAPAYLAMLLDRSRSQRTYELGGTMAVGRGRTCQIVLDHPSVSRQHAWLKMEGNACWILDMGSTNGTYVNGQLLREARRLHHGDVVRFGEAELVFVEV